MCSSLFETKMSSKTAAGEMTKTKVELLNVLAKLKVDEFKKFKWFLEQDEILVGFSGVAVDELEDAKREKTVDLIVQKYQEPKALQLIMTVLEKINRNDLVQRLQNTCSGPIGGERNIGAAVEQTPYTSDQPAVINNEEIRIVLMGKTRVGKSATGNTILGSPCFKSEFSLTTVTEHCEKVVGIVEGQKVAVIDTPGLFDTSNTEEKTAEELAQSISYASPGPHIFLVVIRLSTFKEDEKHIVEKIQKIFDEKAKKYCMVLFTHGDLLKGKPIEEFLKHSKDMQELVAKYNNQYHVFNNEVKDRSQVSELLKKIRNINVKNGGKYYTTEMLQKAEREIKEEKERILKEKDEQNRKEQDELKKKIEEKYQQLMREEKADRERENKLRDACEREMKEEIKKLKEDQDKQVRKEAEENPSMIQKFGNILLDVAGVLVAKELHRYTAM